MPSNILATTGTNVSIIFLDAQKQQDKVMLMDASSMGQKIKVDGKNQRTVLRDFEIEQIISTFNCEIETDDFSVMVSLDQISKNKFSLSAGQYFTFKLPYVEISEAEFDKEMQRLQIELGDELDAGAELNKEICAIMERLKWNQ